MTTNGTTAQAPRLKQRFNDEIAPRLFEEFSYGNVMQVPRVVKVVVNAGVGESLGPGGAAILENCVSDMTTICGQKPVVNKARKSIANFKLREGNNVGVSCTLRGARMWGVSSTARSTQRCRVSATSRACREPPSTGRGNYSLGIREQIVYPEIDYGSVDKVRGLQVNIITTARTDAEGRTVA